MTKKLIKKHDELSKSFLTDIESAKSFLKLHLDPKVVKKCDLNTLYIEPNSYIDNELREKYSDIVYKLDLKNKTSCIYVYVLVEHQSSAERLMPLRILKYQIEIIQTHIAQYKTEENLPLVVPLVFYNGDKSPYPYAIDILDLFADKKLVADIGLGRFNLVDLTVTSEYEILKHKQLALLEMCLKHINARNFNNVIDHILNAFIVAHKNKIDKKLFDSSISYLMNAKEYDELKPLFTQLIDNFNEYEGDIMTYAEQLRLEGKKEGKNETKMELVQEMLKAGAEISFIEKVSHLSKKEIEKIKKTMH
ncbi:MAG: Rpn family recombination-promoting nuclease/putative transposase [Burkholderiales bacterium]|nr:Rpn family recombination-promoting nuclease/putative transposase [Burkholderiales bacterium]